MAEKFKFFNAQEIAPGIFDREYQAADFADYFGSVLSTGLLHTNNAAGLAVSVETGTLNTVVQPGKAILKGHLYENTTALTLNHSIPEATLDRIDRVVLRLDLRNSAREIRLKVKEGTPASAPVAPELQRDNFIHELSLAQVRVRANTASMNQADLKDERLLDDLCGLVQWMIRMPTGRFQEQWDTFMEGIKNEGFAPLADTGFKTDLKTTNKTSIVNAINSIVEDYVRSPGYASVSHSGNIYPVALNPAPVALTVGMGIILRSGNDGTGSPRVDINGLGAKPILKSNGLPADPFKANSVYTLRYNGTSFILQGEGGGDKREVNSLVNLGLSFTTGVYDEVVTYSDSNFRYVTSKKYNTSSRITIDFKKIVKETGTIVAYGSIATNYSGPSYCMASYVHDRIIISTIYDTGVGYNTTHIYAENGTLLATSTTVGDIAVYFKDTGNYLSVRKNSTSLYNSAFTYLYQMHVITGVQVSHYFSKFLTKLLDTGQYRFFLINDRGSSNITDPRYKVLSFEPVQTYTDFSNASSFNLYTMATMLLHYTS